MKSVFYDDVRQRKIISRGARHRVSRRLSHQCSLPSDHMTEKQWKERNGPIMTYQLNAPMTWDAFKSLPSDIRQEYLNLLQVRFLPNWATLARCFTDDVSPDEVKEYVKSQGLRFTSVRGCVSKSILEAVERFRSGGTAPSAPPVEANKPKSAAASKPISVSKPKQEKKKKEGKLSAFAMRSFSLSFVGPMDASMVSNSLRDMAPDGLPCEVSITVRLPADPKYPPA